MEIPLLAFKSLWSPTTQPCTAQKTLFVESESIDRVQAAESNTEQSIGGLLSSGYDVLLMISSASSGP